MQSLETARHPQTLPVCVTPVMLFPAHQAAPASLSDLVTLSATGDSSITASLKAAQLSSGIYFFPSI